MQPFDILNRSKCVFGPHLLEASAGTGKTFAIEHLVLRLILEGNLSIDQILVVTFTRAATKELKQRIRSNLEWAIECLKKGENDKGYDYIQAILEKKEALYQRRLEDALIDFDRAPIFTIHGFCFRMLKNFAFEARLSLHIKDPEEEGFLDSKEAAADFLRTKLHPSSYSPRQVLHVLKKHKSDFPSLQKKLTDVALKRKKIDKIDNFSELHAKFLKGLKRFSFEPLEKVIPLFKGISSSKMEAQIQKFAFLLDKKECSEKEFDTLLKEEEYFLEKLERDNLKAKAIYPDLPFLAEMKKELLAPLLEAKDSSLQFLRMARDFSQIPKENKEIFTPDDLLYAMEDCLKNPLFIEAVRKIFNAIIVDEFQDTDPLQWKIFETLFLQNHQPDAFYLVGDPKQSIYRFRGADVYTYLEARERLGEQSRYSLDTNFRSDPVFIKALNLLFSKCPTWLELPSKNSAIDYLEVKHKPEATDHFFEDGKGAFHFFLLETASKREKSWPPLSTEETYLFPFIAKEIISLKKEAVDLNKMTILAKDRFQAERLSHFFKKQGIDSALKKGESPSLLSLTNLISSLIEPNSLSKLKIVMGGSFFGWDHVRLKGGLENVELQKAKMLLLHFSQVFREKGFSHFIKEVPGVDRDLIECILEKETSCRLAPEDLLLFLEELKENQENKKLKGTKDQVQIMTIHASKGLEFDIVFALSLSSRHPHLDEFIDIKGQITLASKENPLSSLYFEEQDAEKLRQLYVAITRAKKRVYIPCVFDTENKTQEPGKASSIELFSKHLKVAYSLIEFKSFLEEIKEKASITYTLLNEEILTLSPLKKEEEEGASPLIQNALPSNPSFMQSFSSLAEKKESIVSAENTGMPLGKETGILIHLIFEKLFFYRLHSPYNGEKVLELILHLIDKSHLAGWESSLLTMVEKVLELPLKEGLSLSLVSPSNIIEEMEFLYPYGSNFLKGSADLVFEHGGLYYLVDWKSNFLENYTEERLSSEMKDKDYFLQASIYAEALKRHVKLFDMRDFKTCFGGAFYIFLRGLKSYHFTPEV